MPDVHVDSMIFQYPFFLSFFFPLFIFFLLNFSCIFEVTLHLILSSRLTAFGSLICLVFSSSACFGFNTYLQCHSVENNQFVFGGDEFALFWLLWSVLVLLLFGLFYGLFLCTLWFFCSLVCSSWFSGVVFSWIQVLRLPATALASGYSLFGGKD